jgi:hypothetical protein
VTYLRVDWTTIGKGICMRFWNGVRGTACCAVLTVALVAVFGVGTAGAASGTTFYVATGGSDTTDCTDQSSPCETIQFAVDQADAGDTVEVAAGVYDEPQIEITKPLTLQGAGAGESIVDGSSATLSGPLLRYESATVGDVTVGGFTFEGSNGDALGGEGLLMLFSKVPAGSRVSVVDNELLSRNDPFIATDWSLGLFVASSAAAIDIEDNRFEGMWQGILVEGSTGPTTIAGNEFAGLVSNTDAPDVYPGEGILILAIGDAVTSPQLVSDNHFHGYAGLGVAVQAGRSSAPGSPSSFSDVTVAGNEIDLGGAMFPSTGRPLGGVILKTGQADSTIEGADIVGNTISVSAPGNDIAAEAAEGAISGTAAHANRLVGTPAAGLDASLAGPVDATDNWWGCNAGPGHPGCTAASGLVASVPNLVLRGVASRPRVEPGQSAVVTAGLATNSAGAPVAGVPDGAPVAFAASLGSLLPATAPLVGGVASATFRADARLGDAGVTVALDGERVGVPLKVVSPPTKTPPPRSTVKRPPMIKPIGTGPRDVPANGQVTVAWVSCPKGTCRVVVKSPKVTIGGRAYEVRVRVPKRVSAGHPARVRVVLSRAARRAFAEQGRGRVTLRLIVTAPDGTRRAVRVTVVLKDKQGKHRHGQG